MRWAGEHRRPLSARPRISQSRPEAQKVFPFASVLPFIRKHCFRDVYPNHAQCQRIQVLDVSIGQEEGEAMHLQLPDQECRKGRHQARRMRCIAQ